MSDYMQVYGRAERATHTPGPWLHFDDGGTTANGTKYGKSHAGVVWGPEGPGHGTIANCSPYGTPTAKDIANARLIAAAPDLLAALEDVYWRWNDQLSNDDAIDGSEMVDFVAMWWKEKGLPALRKATGEEIS